MLFTKSKLIMSLVEIKKSRVKKEAPIFPDSSSEIDRNAKIKKLRCEVILHYLPI